MTPYQPNDEITIYTPFDPDGTFSDVTVISHEPLTNTYLILDGDIELYIHASDIIEHQ